MTGQELAERYGVARSAVIQFLRSQGVPIRRPRLTEEELAQIVALYMDGVRQVDIEQRAWVARKALFGMHCDGLGGCSVGQRA